MSQRFSDYTRRERDDYPTSDWVRGLVIPHLQVMGANTIWEPAAGAGGMADALAGAGFCVVSTELKNGIDFLDGKAWPPDIAQQADAVVTNPPYGVQGKTAEKFIERSLVLTRPHNGLVAVLLKVDPDSGASGGGFSLTVPRGHASSFCLKRILWFESRNGMGPSENHAWFYGPGDMPGRQRLLIPATSRDPALRQIQFGGAVARDEGPCLSAPVSCSSMGSDGTGPGVRLVREVTPLRARRVRSSNGCLGSTASRLGIAANHATAGVASKLLRNQRLRQERVILIDLSTRRAIMNENEAILSSSPPRLQPWNKGKLIGAKPPLRASHVWSIRTKLQLEGRTRDLALFNSPSTASCAAAMLWRRAVGRRLRVERASCRHLAVVALSPRTNGFNRFNHRQG